MVVNIFRLPLGWLWWRHVLSCNNEGRIALKCLMTNSGRWLRHPNVQRYKGREGELLQRIIDLQAEMVRRGFHPKKPVETYGLMPKSFMYTEDEMREDLVVALYNIARSRVRALEKKVSL